MKKNILFVICLFGSSLINAQAPSLQWVKGFGGLRQSIGVSIASDTFGNVYTAGLFEGLCDFDPGSDTFNLYAAPIPTTVAYDIFISKLNASGEFLWAKNFGGTYNDGLAGIALDGLNNIYIVGRFNGTVDFDPGPGIFNITSSSSSMFISKLDNNGNFVWAKSVEVGGGDGYSIALDDMSNLYIGCRYMGTSDFDPGSGIFNLTSNGNSDVAVLKLNSAGDFVWAKSMGGVNWEFGGAVALDNMGNVYVGGEFMGSGDFDPGIVIENLTSAGGSDIFISKLNSAGDFIWAKSFGGTASEDHLRSICLDGLSNVYISGLFEDTVDFDPGAGVTMLASAGANDIFISKLDSFGNFVWANRLGGTSQEFCGDLEADETGNVYAIGSFNLTADFDPGPGTFNITAVNFYDIFMLKFNTLGQFVWAGSLGGASQEFAYCLTFDASDNIYSTGYFHETVDFDPSGGLANLTSAGSNDVFVHKMSQGLVAVYDNIPSVGCEIYPNPTNGLFNVVVPATAKNTLIEIYNSLGVLVYKKNKTNKLCTIELTNQENGIYFVKIISDDQIFSQKVIKQ